MMNMILKKVQVESPGRIEEQMIIRVLKELLQDVSWLNKSAACFALRIQTGQDTLLWQ